MAIQFNQNDTRIFVAEENNVSVFQASNGLQIDDSPYTPSSDEEAMAHGHSTVDSFFSAGLDFLALVYRNRPLAIWNLGRGCIECRIAKENENFVESPQVTSVAFHPKQEVGLVAVAYRDRDMILYNIWDGNQEAEVNIQADTMAISPDGRTLAAGDADGIIYLLNFETLRLIYRITTTQTTVQELVFAFNHVRFLDVRRDHCNIWEPAALVRKEGSDDSASETQSEDILQPPVHADTERWNPDRAITIIVEHHSGNYFFCARADGSIALYDTRSGVLVQELFRHWKHTKVHLLDWNASQGIITSADECCRYTSRKVWQAEGTWHVGPPILDKLIFTAVRQILTSPDGKRLLVSSANRDTVWDLEDPTVKFYYTAARHDSRQWTND